MNPHRRDLSEKSRKKAEAINKAENLKVEIRKLDVEIKDLGEKYTKKRMEKELLCYEQMKAEEEARQLDKED